MNIEKDCLKLKDAGIRAAKEFNCGTKAGFVLTKHASTATPFIASVDEDTIWVRRPNGSTYDIPREELRDPAKLLHWIEHLSEKNWVSAESIGELLRFVRSEGKVDIHR